MGRRKPHKIVIREDRLSKLDATKMEVAIWLLARGKVEDRTQRSQPAPPVSEVVDIPAVDEADERGRADAPEAA
jgi:hypothetical protein